MTPDTTDSVLRDAAEALARHDRLRTEMRQVETDLRTLCRRYDRAAGVWGSRPEHLRYAIEARDKRLNRSV